MLLFIVFGNVRDVLNNVMLQLATPIAQWLRHQEGRPLLGWSKFHSNPNELKFGTGMFSATPDTKVTFVLCEYHAIVLGSC